LLLDPPLLMAALFFLTHCLKSYHGGFGGGGKSVMWTPFRKIKWIMTTLLRICNVKVRTKTTFYGFSSSQPRRNGQVGWGQDQYLLPYVSWSKLMWNWQSKSHLHKGLSVSAGGFSSWFRSFGGRPLFFSLSFCLTYLGNQGFGSLLPIVCGLCVWIRISSLPRDVVL
jgi:hypothetical protein